MTCMPRWIGMRWHFALPTLLQWFALSQRAKCWRRLPYCPRVSEGGSAQCVVAAVSCTRYQVQEESLVVPANLARYGLSEAPSGQRLARFEPRRSECGLRPHPKALASSAQLG